MDFEKAKGIKKDLYDEFLKVEKELSAEVIGRALGHINGELVRDAQFSQKKLYFKFLNMQLNLFEKRAAEKTGGRL